MRADDGPGAAPVHGADAAAGVPARRRRRSAATTVGRARAYPLLVGAALLLPMGLFAAVAGAYSQITPLGQAPDEAAHAAYLGLIAHSLQLPGPGTPERQQPPLYYLLGAGVLKLTGGNQDAVRDLSVALGALTVLVAVLAARELWPRQPGWWLLAGLLVAALPEFQFISGSITDDAIADLSAALLTYLLVRVLRGPMTPRLQLLVGVGIGAGILSKETDYILVAMVALAALLRWWPQGGRWLTTARVAVPALLVSGWWVVRNMVVFGRPLPHFHSLAAPSAGAPTKLQHMSQVGGWIALAFHSFIGVFGNMSTPLLIDGQSKLVFRVIEVVTVIAAIVLVGMMRQRWADWDGWTRLTAAVLIAIPVLAFAQMLANSILVNYQAQGRYLIVALPAIALGLTFLARELARARPPAVVGAAAMVLIAGIAVVDWSGLQTVAFHLLNTPIVPGHHVVT